MKRFALLSSVLVVFHSGASQAAPEMACTEMACIDGLVLNVHPDRTWLPGNYEFTFKLDGREVHCMGALPLKSCEVGPSVQCDGEGVQITESGCAMPPETHGFGSITFSEAPAAVDIRIVHEGNVLAERSISPAYETVRPNGPECEPSCRSASEDLFPRGL
ncbi:MAG TPA: hypothetical protein DEA55_03770 [Rhodospirillaceae bacterium]|nr:hypothetical protein [Rhodospirillaceae bacterium]